MTDILTRALAPSDQAIESAVGEETVLLHLENGTYYGLDPVGTRIWALLKDGLGPLAIRDVLVAEYGVAAEVIEADLRKFLTDLHDQSIVTDA
ncbi:MAG: PqqD family protein [Rhodobacterales bacterium]|nr:PqqD family protein [Rhodobacterales bacterium]NCT12311.1 PqqD family protein [Rhodobacterales bacterium]